MQNDNLSKSDKKTGSPRFPQMSLRSAINRAAIVWKADGKHSVRLPALSKHWNYSEKSSGLRSCVAALLHFGLFEQTATGTLEYTLTKRAQMILAGNEDEKLTAMRDAAREPRVYQEILQRFGEQLPSNENLTSRLVLDWHFNPDSTEGFLKDFRETIALAKLDKPIESSGESEKEQSDTSTYVPPNPGLDIQKNEQEKAAKVAEAKAAFAFEDPSKKILPLMRQDLRYLPIPLDIGDAPIPVGMSNDDFELLIATLNLWKKKIVRSEFPKSATWRNKDSDMPVVIVGVAGEREGVKYYQSSTGTGISALELDFH